MARSTEPKRATARRAVPAKRAPARKPAPTRIAKAAEPERVDEQTAPPPVETSAPAVAVAPQPPVTEAGAPAAEPSASVDAGVEAPTGEGMPAAAAEPEAAPLASTAAAEEAVSAAAADVAVAAPEPLKAAAAVVWPRRRLVEDTIQIQSRMVAFACRQTECSLAAGRALLASRSLPEMMSLQSTFIGQSVENTVAHTLELTRLSAEMLREGLSPGRSR